MLKQHGYDQFVTFAHFQFGLFHLRHIVNTVVVNSCVEQPLQWVKEGGLPITVVPYDERQAIRELKRVLSVVTTEILDCSFPYKHSFTLYSLSTP